MFRFRGSRRSGGNVARAQVREMEIYCTNVLAELYAWEVLTVTSRWSEIDCIEMPQFSLRCDMKLRVAKLLNGISHNLLSHPLDILSARFF